MTLVYKLIKFCLAGLWGISGILALLCYIFTRLLELEIINLDMEIEPFNVNDNSTACLTVLFSFITSYALLTKFNKQLFIVALSMNIFCLLDVILELFGQNIRPPELVYFAYTMFALISITIIVLVVKYKVERVGGSNQS